MRPPPPHNARQPGETTSTLLGPLHLVIYILTAFWVLLMGVCIVWEICKRKNSGKKIDKVAMAASIKEQESKAMKMMKEKEAHLKMAMPEVQ